MWRRTDDMYLTRRSVLAPHTAGRASKDNHGQLKDPLNEPSLTAGVTDVSCEDWKKSKEDYCSNDTGEL